MARINVYAPDDTEGDYLAGWFDDDRAECWSERTYWDGDNHCSLATRSPHVHEALYRTAGGRWVVDRWSIIAGDNPRPRFVTTDEAREWLLRCEYDDAEVEAATGAPVEPERGPGRPEIGPAFSVRFPAELLARVDRAAGEAGVTRAAWLRRIAESALFNRP